MRSVVSAALLLAMAAAPVHAQQKSAGPAGPAVVNEGNFQLVEGKAVDLTDRKVLFAFPPDLNRDRKLMEDRRLFSFRIGGEQSSLSVGQRYNLKSAAPPQVREKFKDKRDCYLEFLDLAVPKGAPAVATLRLECS